MLIWVIICSNGYGFAFISPSFVLLGIYSFLIDPHGSLRMHILSVPVQTVTEKIAWTLSRLVMGTLGMWFFAWHRAAKRSGDGA